MTRHSRVERRAVWNIARQALLIAFAVVWASAMMLAQAVGANIGGVVIDDTGARVPGVTVTVTNKATGATQVFLTGRRETTGRSPSHRLHMKSRRNWRGLPHKPTC